MTSVASATTWGSPTATKHALLIHGMTATSLVWHRVAPSLASQGYFVTAPNLIGHAQRVSSDYHIKSIAEDLRPYLEARNYSLIIGHSLGGPIAVHLLPFISRSHPTAIILVDPPLRSTPEESEYFRADSVDSCIDIKSAEAWAAENALMTREDCIYRVLGKHLSSIEGLNNIVTQNQPWHYLDWLNDVSEKWKVSVIISDPAICNICPVEDFASYPHIETRIVPGATHLFLTERPDVVIEEALKKGAELDVDQKTIGGSECYQPSCRLLDY